jgi:hypothetical protein
MAIQTGVGGAQPAGMLGASEYALQESIAAYSEELYTNAKKLSGTGIAGADAEIDTSGETFIGQLRWKKPLDAKINIISLVDPTEGTKTVVSTDYAKYVKTARSHGARQINMAQIVTQQDGLAKIATDFAETRARDEHNALFATLRAVAISEALTGTGTNSGSAGLGGQTYDNDVTDRRYGFYVDLGANKLVSDASASSQGAQRADGFLKALAMGYKDYEPDFAYLTVTPEVLASLRSANLVDTDRISEGGLEFQTILGGKFRLILSRANFSFSSVELANLNEVVAGAGVDIVGTKTSMIILPNAIAFNNIAVPMPVEVERRAATYQGGGSTDLWYRWAYVAHPRGYTWNGSEDEFSSDASVQAVGAAGAITSSLNVAGTVIDNTTRSAYARKATSTLSLGILPVFHA